MDRLPFELIEQHAVLPEAVVNRVAVDIRERGRAVGIGERRHGADDRGSLIRRGCRSRHHVTGVRIRRLRGGNGGKQRHDRECERAAHSSTLTSRNMPASM
jgi:hypothetical protein